MNRWRRSGDSGSFHFQHGLKGPLGFGGIGIHEHFGQDPGDHLPGEAELVRQPAALLSLRRAALGQPRPVVIHFLLRLALDLERDGFIELENRASIEGGK